MHPASRLAPWWCDAAGGLGYRTMGRSLVIAAAILLGPAAAHATRLYGLGAQTCAAFVAQYVKQPELTEIVYYTNPPRE